MKKIISFICCSLFAHAAWSTNLQTYHIAEKQAAAGYVVEKIWLEHYAMPQVRLLNPAFVNKALPTGIKAENPQNITLMLGEERKRYFVLVKVPAYSEAGGQARLLTDFTLEIEEKTTGQPTTNFNSKAKTTGTNTPLSAGNWYKISVTQKGLYKIDYDFIKNTLKVDPATINTANFRVFGNGGTMLPQANADFRYPDLTENAVWVNDGGDGVLNQGDYIVFYANGPMAWDKDSLNARFNHRKNLYEDKSYYFLNFDQGAGKRITNQNGVPAANVTVSSFDDYQVHEEDLFSPGNTGKEWWGEEFSIAPGKQNVYDVSFNLGQPIDSAYVKIQTGCIATVGGNLFNVTLNGQQFGNYMYGQIPLDATGSPIVFISTASPDLKRVLVSSTSSFHISFQPGVSDGKGYLNYIELNYRRALSLANGQLSFRDWRSVGNGNVASYQLQNANGNTQVWDVTDALNPVKVNGGLNGSTYTFSQDASQLHEFIASDGSQYFAPAYVGPVANQNLHAAAQMDYIIVTDTAFLTAANQLADFHRQHDNMRVLVTTTNQIYNEFSSGSQDISAIRDMAKMFYDRAGTDSTQLLRYMLLLGDASYDYKNRIGSNTNYVPTFESQESVNTIYSYSGDDYFAFLGDNENIEDNSQANTLDIGVGRIPVGTATDATAVVNKIMHYKAPASLGPWRLVNTYIADNEDDAGTHLLQSEQMCAQVDSEADIYNDVKVYLDNLPFVSTPGGERCPDANKAINDQVFKGTFLINYSGHGSIATLAHERILTADDFNTWKNYDKLPFMVTATCDFSRFDDPAYVSAGEKLILKSDGGAIALLTTTQLTFADANRDLNIEFLAAQFQQQSNGSWNTFGEAFRRGKNVKYQIPNYGGIINFRKFTLLGDPALQPDFPQYFVKTDSIKSITNGSLQDTISALGGYSVSGSVNDAAGQKLSNFNGQLYVTIYDKPRVISLMTKVYNDARQYDVQDNIIYKGKATVTNGQFSFSFIAPKDLNYEYGHGKITYYAENGETDAAGIDTAMVVGGYSDNPITDNDPPIVKPYMNDSFFVDGGITGSSTVLFVSLYDETGINISGNGVGHDLTAVLDGDIQNPISLNDYYETAPNVYQRGYVNFPISGLADGPHNFRVKAWDVNNNSGEGTVNFVVFNGNVVKIDKLMNYPNPFSNSTHIVFEHNHPDEALKGKLVIYNMAGALVRNFEIDYTPSGSRSYEITWDGTDNRGAKLPDGVYVYRINISTATGIQQTAYQKMILIR